MRDWARLVAALSATCLGYGAFLTHLGMSLKTGSFDMTILGADLSAGTAGVSALLANFSK
jgi:hypothetical protein